MTSAGTPCAAQFVVCVRRSHQRRRQQSGLVTALGFLCLLYFKGLAMTHALFSTYQHPDSVERISKAILEFTLLLYKECVAHEKSNAGMSPLGICAALAMAYAGACQDTATEIKAAMRLPHDSTDLNYAFEDILGSLLGLERPGIKLHFANRMYVQYYTHILPEFLGVVNNHYRTSVAVVNFQGDTETVRQQINRWVESQTNDKINNIVNEGVIDSLTQLVLVNGVYFKGSWERKFDSLLTKPGNFFLNSTKRVTVEMMEQLGWFYSGGSIDLQCRILEMPYVGKDMSMFIILPNEIDGLRELEEGLNPKTIAELFNKMYESKVHIVMPRLHIETSYEMEDMLKKLGLISLFKKDHADFSGITGSPNLHMSAILHKAALEVNEEGNIAPPRTNPVMERSMPLAEPEFLVNHPFLVLVRDNHANLILFMGRVVNPADIPITTPSRSTIAFPTPPRAPQVRHPAPTVKFAPCPVIQYYGPTDN